MKRERDEWNSTFCHHSKLHNSGRTRVSTWSSVYKFLG